MYHSMREQPSPRRLSGPMTHLATRTEFRASTMQWLTYSEIRTGGGFDWKISPTVSFTE
jgi:hypothetical protein